MYSRTTLDIIETTIDRAERLVRQPPLENKLVIGASSLQLAEGRLYGLEHGRIILAHGDAFRRCGKDGAANFKVARILFNVVIRYGRVLVGRDNAVINKQLYHRRLILQGNYFDGRLILLLAIIAGTL